MTAFRLARSDLEELIAMKHYVTGASLAAVLLLGGALTAADVKSGPPVGKGVGAFHPLHCTGSQAGQKACLV
jgi:hypothetical protein